MSISGLKQSAREVIRKNALKLVIVVITYILITTVLLNLYYHVSGLYSVMLQLNETILDGEPRLWQDSFESFRTFGILLSVILALFSSVIEVGFIGYCLKLSRGGSGDYKEIFDGFALFGKIIAIAVLTRIFTFLWSLLLIVPGIVASYRYSQAYFILLDNPEMSALECIRESKKLMVGNKLDLFILELSFIGWLILAFLLFMLTGLPLVMTVIDIWRLPYLTIAKAGFYNNLIRYNPETANPGDQKNLL